MARNPRKMRNYQFRVKKKGRWVWKNLRYHAPKLIRGSVIIFISCIALALVGGTGYLMCRLPFFQVKEVNVHGCARIQRERVIQLSDLKGKNIISLNLRQVARRIKQERWIEQVVVRRELPDRIEICLKERQAVALVNLDAIWLVDEKGRVFMQVSDDEYFDLPMLTGLSREYLKREPQKANQLIRQALTLVPLVHTRIGLSQENISEIHINPDTGFSFYDVESTTQVKLGLSDFYEKLERYRKLRRVMDKERTPRVIDLRYKDKIFVTLDAAHTNRGSKEVKKNG
jgi:cell division protein FtsQ